MELVVGRLRKSLYLNNMLRLLSIVVLISSLFLSFCSGDSSDDFVGMYEASYTSSSFRNAVGITSNMEGDTLFGVRD